MPDKNVVQFVGVLISHSPLVKSIYANQSDIYFHLKLDTSITPLGVTNGLFSLSASFKSLNIGLTY